VKHLAALMMLLLAPALPGQAQVITLHEDPRPALLKQLDGEWVMKGDVLGKKVTYLLVAGPTLQASFTELHMLDVADPPQYEARVFLGFDAESGDLIAHWLDAFGARFSIPHGTGRIDGSTLQFTLPYSDGPFRDTFEFDQRNGSWNLRIESGQPDGSWKHFARYEIRRQVP
jgi:hypothetical protein